MVEQAQEFIRRQTGTYYNLFNQPPEQNLEDFIGKLSNSQISVDGPEVVFGRLFDHVGYDAIGGLFRPLVLSRLVAPGSKLKTVDYLWRYNGVSYDVNKIYRYLDKLCGRKGNADDIKSKIEQITFAHGARAMGGCIDVVFYDITTLYFEVAGEDDLRRTGYLKDGKFDCPQILLGLLVTREGLPISYEIFQGDLSEKKTFIPLLKRAQQKFGFPSPIVVADAGLLSRKNIDALSIYLEQGLKTRMPMSRRKSWRSISQTVRLHQSRQTTDYVLLCHLQKSARRKMLSTAPEGFCDSRQR